LPRSAKAGLRMTVINSVQVCENVAFMAASPRLTPCDRFDVGLTFNKLSGTVFRWLILCQEPSFIYHFKINGEMQAGTFGKRQEIKSQTYLT
jgi:hypothetical protein